MVHSGILCFVELFQRQSTKMHGVVHNLKDTLSSGFTIKRSTIFKKKHVR